MIRLLPTPCLALMSELMVVGRGLLQLDGERIT